MFKKLIQNLTQKKLKYLVVGAGSTGATFACFLKSANKDITLLSKYQSIIEMSQEKGGIRLVSNVKKDKKYKVKIKTLNDYDEKADVIILCVRTPDILSTIPIVEKAKKENTVIFSISNGFGIGYSLSQKFKDINVLEANFVGKCRWYNREDVTFLQQREYCELNLANINNSVNENFLKQIKDDFTQSGMITNILTNKEFIEESFKRLITRSPFEATCIYYDICAHDFKDEKLETFKKLCNELLVLAKAMNIDIRDVFLKEYFDNFEKYKERDDANVYSSILHDMKNNIVSEIDFLFFIVIELAKKYNVELPTYFMIAEKFKTYNTLNKYLTDVNTKNEI